MKNYTELFEEFLDLTEFTLVRHQNDWSLIDRQGANLGDIESDRFDNAAQILDRMDCYIQDYIVEPIKQELDAKNIDNIDRLTALCGWEDILEYRVFLPESQWDFDVLDMIVNHFDEINLEQCFYEEEN